MLVAKLRLSVGTPEIQGDDVFVNSTKVSIVPDNEADEIYYTLDGTDPTTASTVYTEPFTLSESATGKAIAAYKSIVSPVASKVFNKVDAKWDSDNKNATLTLVAKYDYNDTTLQKIIDQIKGSDQNEALDFALNGNYTKAGVVARTIRGQTYVAISLRVGRNL